MGRFARSSAGAQRAKDTSPHGGFAAIGCFGAALLVLSPAAASAQALADGAPVGGSADAGPAIDQADDIVVTATRRTEKEQDVPFSTSVIEPRQLVASFAAGGDIRALANSVPGLNIESSAGRTFPRFYIRGYGNTDFSIFASQPVSLVYDDVVAENAALKAFPIFDVADVEVLRGPQGTLFGRNAPAGVVQIQSVKPVLGETSGSFSLAEGRYNSASFTGALNVPLSDVMAARASVQVQHRDDWVSDPINASRLEGFDDVAGRLQLLYQPNARFSALFNVHGRHQTGSARLFRANIITPGTNRIVPGFDPAAYYGDSRNTAHFDSIGASARLMLELPGVSLVSITGYETILSYYGLSDTDGGYGAAFEPTMGPTVTRPDGSVIGIPFPVSSAGAIDDHHQITQELRAASDYAGPLNWLAGLYYFHDTTTAGSLIYEQTGTTLTSSNHSRQDNDAYAAFGSLVFKPSARFDLRAGLRFTHDAKTFTIVDAFNQSFAQTRARAKGDNLSGDLSATYAVTPDFKIYGRLATGFRAPSFGAPTNTVGIQIAKAETNRSAEIGFKSFLADRRIKLNADIYYYRVRNQQLTAVGGADNSTRLLNARRSVGYGGEVEMDAKVSDRLQLSASAGYNRTRIEDRDLAVAVCASCTVTDPRNAQGNALIYGNPLPQAAKWTLDAGVAYTVPVAAGRELFFNADLAYRSSVNFFLYESKEFTGRPLADLGLRGGFRWGDGKYEVAAFCRNCLDQIRVIGAIDFNNLTGMINDPVIYGIQLSGKF
ncbi:TonB-dependent receptor [Novosphingobium mathurense]|uniref:Iron complex outermembrane recepter protein n=1 Tax=Novosphingobium mathurense TaxID=428990 RepID=A0A1U6H695_9SPHN|nr:TonB-dependent receptor [Novosphingobium mathurense]SLJ91295.1 iron complex outermembrane recepter protein [Novosphingobium mathurense]